MADFRKKMLVLASLAVIGAASASAQTNFNCTAAVANPLQMRAEGLTEPAGDVVLNCSGTVPTGLSQFNLTVSLNTAITSRIQASGLSEATLLVGEPAPGSQFSVGPVAPATTPAQNVYYGTQTAANQVTFLGIPVSSPVVYRITNIRANANALGVATGISLPNNVVENVSSSTGFLIQNPTQVVGAVQRGLLAAVVSGSANFLQCASQSGASAFGLTITEGFGTAFKVRETPGQQNTPGFTPNTESMFEVGVPAGTTTPSAFGAVGAADFGTRFQVNFPSVPTGVTVTVPLTLTAPDGAVAQLVTSATGPIALAASGTVTGNVAVYEITTAEPFAIDVFTIGTTVSFTGNPSANSPNLGVSSTSVSFAPTSTVTVASNSTVPIPRFADTSSPIDTFSVSACSTTLLFPFVSNIAGFDTGIAISNTSTDPFGTKGALPQSGTCKLTFYGSGAPAAFTTAAAVASGTSYTTLASTVAPGFQGYMFAQCAFQFAHGFAFITDGFGGPGRGLSQGYLALVIPDPTQFSRVPSPGSSALGNSGEALFQ